jgi:hypothetical protein
VILASLVFCIFGKPVHAAITVCTWLDTMLCVSNLRIMFQLIVPYVIPLYDTQPIGYLYVQQRILPLSAVFLQNRAN